MKFEKHLLGVAEKGYAIGTAKLLGATRIVAASEAESGQVVVFTPGNFEQALLADGPGGCMGFAQPPGRDDALFIITGLYPIFLGDTGGVNLIRATGKGLGAPWRNDRIVDLPFTHRIAVLEGEGGAFLLVANACSGKANLDDWTQPGAVYAVKIPEHLDGPWSAVPVLEGITKNHGMSAGVRRGKRCVYISGEQGLFAITMKSSDGSADGGFEVEHLMDHEISEIGFVDYNGDGDDELVTIEPFHGNRVVVYKSGGSKEDSYEKVWEDSLDFGHGLWAGTLSDRPAFVVGNRAGEKDLVCYTAADDPSSGFTRTVVDHGAGTANVAVVSASFGDEIVSSNPEHGEYARYTVVWE